MFKARAAPRKCLFDDIKLVKKGNKKILEISKPFKAVPSSEKITNRALYSKTRDVDKFCKGEIDKVILADKDNPVSLGGGFVQIDAQDVLFVKRDDTALRKPGLLDISAGLFDESFKHPVEMMISETAEIVRRKGDSFLLPVPKEKYVEGYYIESLKKEFEKSLKALKVSGEIMEAKANIIYDKSYAVLEYDGEESLSVIVSLEPDNGSVEIIGTLKVDAQPSEYSDGEYAETADGFLPLNREIHQVSLNSLVDRVWKSFTQIRVTGFLEVIREIRKNGQNSAYTSKVASALRAMTRISYPISKALEMK